MSKKLKSSGAKSPFLCKDVQNIDKLLEANEEDEIFAWWNYEVFMERLDETFTSAIPSEDIRAMPAKYRYPIGILLVLSLVALLIDLIYTAYTVARNTQYLSPLDGDTASANCEAITTTNSGNYLFSFTGYWQGSTGFEYAQASFELLLTSYSSTTSNFNAGMDSLYSGISNLGTYMKTYDLSINILVWTSYAILIETNNTANRFVMSGDPVVVFDRQHVTVSSMSIHGICNITAATGFDYATGSLYVTYPYKEYMNHPVCNETFNPLYAGYVPGLTEDTIDLAIDVRSLVTAIAVNINLISFDQLVEIEAYRDLIEYANVPYIVSMYYDPKYVGMSPISCIQNLNHTVRQCLLTPNNRLYAIPILNHFGNSTEFPQKCDCNILLKSPPEEYGNCNLFNFLAGFIFWNNNNANGFFELVIKQGSLFTINNLAYNASYISSYFGQRSSQSAELRSLHSIKKSLEFCNVASYGYCSIMSFSAFDSAPWTFAVSPYYYQLSYGACNDSVTPTEDAWQQLIKDPFAPLQEGYQKCTDSPTEALQTSVGVSVGNLGAATPVVVFLFLAIIGLVQYLTGVRIQKNTYTKKEKEEALDYFAENLLVVRDEYFHNITICSRYEIAPVGKIGVSKWSAEARAKLKDHFVRHIFEENTALAQTVFLQLIKELEKEALEDKMEEDAKAQTDGTADSPMHTGDSESAMNSELRTKSEVDFFSSLRLYETRLVLVINKPSASFLTGGDGGIKFQGILTRTFAEGSSLKLPGSSAGATAHTPPLSDQLETYNDWFASMSALNFKFSQLLEHKQKETSSSQSFEEKYWKLVQETNYFTKKRFSDFYTLAMSSEDHLLMYLLISLLEVHACIALQIYNREKLRTSYASSVGYSFQENVLSLSDFLLITKDSKEDK